VEDGGIPSCRAADDVDFGVTHDDSVISKLTASTLGTKSVQNKDEGFVLTSDPAVTTDQEVMLPSSMPEPGTTVHYLSSTVFLSLPNVTIVKSALIDLWNLLQRHFLVSMTNLLNS
jgi:hypothetical protein